MRLLSRHGRGSGLIVVLAVLAMLAVMATTFVQLMRLDTRVATNYLDDLRCELLAKGMVNYFRGILRDDSDRMFKKYVNRETPVGFYGWYDSRWILSWVPGLGGESWGTTPSRSFWYYAPAAMWSDWSALFGDAGTYTWYQAQGTFSFKEMTIGRYWDTGGTPPRNQEVEVWLDRALNAVDDRGFVVDINHPRAVRALDDDGDGTPSPDVSAPNFYYELSSDYRHYYDSPPFITSAAGGSKFFPGNSMTGEATLPGGMYWRWGAKLGIPTTTYIDLNVAGNLDGADGGYLDNMGGLGLGARRALDETSDRAPYNGTACTGVAPYGSDHLGRIEWRGFSGEAHYAAGFPRNYNIVSWHPSQVGLEKTFFMSWYPTETPLWKYFAPRPVAPPKSTPDSVLVGREKARALIRARWGNDGRSANGSDPWRVGWRRDGASYYKLPCPENPTGDDRYFGTNEVIEHDHSVYHGESSAVSKILGKQDERGVRPYFSTMSTDTILRGKIWPLEGPLPWRPGNVQAGDWRHIDILKRVNINIIGAKASRPGDPTGDEALKNAWALKAPRERDRLYYMLVAAMNFTSTPLARQKACQFIASLTDLVDRDNEETCYVAPDGAWALGVEKFPVINEAAFHSNPANTPNFALNALRIELYNPAENIPWIPDADETYDVSEYRLKIVTNAGTPHVYRVGDLRRYDSTNPNTDLGPVPARIGADAMYAYPTDTVTKKGWNRLLHIGWPTVSSMSFPPDITRAEISGPIQISLWKPLSTDAASGDPNQFVPLNPGQVERVVSGSSRKYLCVDDTRSIQLLPSPMPANGPGQTSALFLGTYRRWDPMNARLFGSPSSSRSTTSNIGWWSANNLTSGTLGKPNYEGAVTYSYRRYFERNFKIVDGDLPSIGWVGELVMWNAATDGPVTWVHSNGQDPTRQTSASELDTRAKFDLFRPFVPVTPTPRYNPYGDQVDPKNLHVLDIFTVWDPSNDGIDNDADGAVDDEDTGFQPGDKGGPEVRVYGRLDINHIPLRVWWSILPHNENLYNFANDYTPPRWALTELSFQTLLGRENERRSSPEYGYQGPYETIGDCLRYDRLHGSPGRLWSAISGWPPETNSGGYGGNCLSKTGFSGLWTAYSPIFWFGDDDGDGIYDERDERDMLWTWLSNFLTTRANVFQLDLVADICDPPYHPGRTLPFKTNRTRRTYARKQLLGILDRSTTLRIKQDGTCDFAGPVDVRLLRFSDDLRID